ncbi:hypothetical protein V8F20_003462 [Naviculisporaceae sp. PSN 640]
MVENDSEGQIAALVFRAISSLETLLSTLDSRLPENASAASHLARFKLWVGSMGAHRSSGGRSLEYRLRDASAVKGQIISLLQDLNNSVIEGVSLREKVSDSEEDDSFSDPMDVELEDYFRNEQTPGSSAISQVLEDIGHVVDCLLRLSITIRNPAPHDHFRSRAGTDISSLYAEWDIKHVREKFPGLAAELCERLGRATAQRRQYLKYREDHTNRLAEGLVIETTPSEFGDSLPGKATTIASSIPNHLKEGEADTLSTSSKYAQFSDSDSVASMTSYAPSSIYHGQLRVPPVPKESGVGPFKCPFCCLIISVNSKREWKKHVFGDLRPYVCTESSCITPDQQYQRRADWIIHMKQHHWRIWNCPFGCPGIFHTSRSFTTHVMELHPEDKAARRINTLQDLSSHFDPKKIECQCPLCGAFQISNEKQFGVHVGNHMEQLALFALPNHGGEDESEDDSGNSNRELDKDEVVHSSDGSAQFDDETWDRDENEVARNLAETRPPLLEEQDTAGSRTSDSRGQSVGESAEELTEFRVGSDNDVDSHASDTPSRGRDAELDTEEERSVHADKHRSDPENPGEEIGHHRKTDDIAITFGKSKFLEPFPPGSISSGILLVRDLINRVITRSKPELANINTPTSDHFAILFENRIYTDLTTPVCDIGVGSSSEVEIIFDATKLAKGNYNEEESEPRELLRRRLERRGATKR